MNTKKLVKSFSLGKKFNIGNFENIDISISAQGDNCNMDELKEYVYDEMKKVQKQLKVGKYKK